MMRRLSKRRRRLLMMRRLSKRRLSSRQGVVSSSPAALMSTFQMLFWLKHSAALSMLLDVEIVLIVLFDCQFCFRLFVPNLDDGPV
jgi:hypothetical protein